MKRLTPMKAIRKHCIACSGDNIQEPKRCTVKKCPLWPYRLGHRPNWDEVEKELSGIFNEN